MIKTQRQKEIVYSKIKDVFEKNDFVFLKGMQSKYVKKTKGRIYSINFDFSSKSNASFASNSLLYISIEEVENIIIEVGFPNFRLNEFSQRKSWLNTILDKKNKLEFNDGNPSHIFLETEEDFIKWADAIIKYLETDGLDFLNHYSYLPNVLKEMDKLEKEGKYWLEILQGNINHIFRGLIISKLCNDYDYERKLKKWEELICTNNKYEKWHSYFQKLKEKLETIEAIYNV